MHRATISAASTATFRASRARVGRLAATTPGATWVASTPRTPSRKSSSTATCKAILCMAWRFTAVRSKSMECRWRTIRPALAHRRAMTSTARRRKMLAWCETSDRRATSWQLGNRFASSIAGQSFRQRSGIPTAVQALQELHGQPTTSFPAQGQAGMAGITRSPRAACSAVQA